MVNKNGNRKKKNKNRRRPRVADNVYTRTSVRTVVDRGSQQRNATNPAGLKMLVNAIKKNPSLAFSPVVRAYLRMVADPFNAPGWYRIPFHATLMPRGPSVTGFTRTIVTVTAPATSEQLVAIMAGWSHEYVGSLPAGATPSYLVNCSSATRIVGPCSTASVSAIGVLRFASAAIGTGVPDLTNSITTTGVTYVEELPYVSVVDKPKPLHWRQTCAAVKMTPLTKLSDRAGEIIFVNPRYRLSDTAVTAAQLARNPDYIKYDGTRTRSGVYIPHRDDLLYHFASSSASNSFQKGVGMYVLAQNASAVEQSWELEVIQGWEVAGIDLRGQGDAQHINLTAAQHIVNAASTAITLPPHSGKFEHAAILHAHADAHPVVRAIEHGVGQALEGTGIYSLASKLAPTARAAASLAKSVVGKIGYAAEEVAPLLA